MTAATLPGRADRIMVMGVLNVTPDSFSDGGRWTAVDDAVARGIALRDAGADLVDVGGESTRPGAAAVAPADELARVLPVVTALAEVGVPLSIDTVHARTAAAALDAGALLVNDVSGGLADRDMARVVADAGCPWVLMHWRGPSDRMAELARYDDVVLEVRDELSARVDAAVAAGIDVDRLVLDPGLGFAKTGEHNWQLLAQLDVIVGLGLPVLVGASRKSFLGRLLADHSGNPRPIEEREDATTALTAVCAAAGVWGVRVHEVRPSVDAALTVAAIRVAR
ncbi:dihydropteroate synthase [uncultured Jatrophihabitans sp.]|uniref:dihydropteroate synthase n=1 Tax=uncultured Jatrophihabitans sp. TaxID=1610747 RepID=UPI0035C9A6F8